MIREAIREWLAEGWFSSQSDYIIEKGWADYVVKQGKALLGRRVNHPDLGEGVINGYSHTEIDNGYTFFVDYGETRKPYGPKELGRLLERDERDRANAALAAHYAAGGTTEDLFSKGEEKR